MSLCKFFYVVSDIPGVSNFINERVRGTGINDYKRNFIPFILYQTNNLYVVCFFRPWSTLDLSLNFSVMIFRFLIKFFCLYF